jgi:hypothetical protein
MKLIANHANGKQLSNELSGMGQEADRVKAEIAYGSNSKILIENCRNSGYQQVAISGVYSEK